MISDVSSGEIHTEDSHESIERNMDKRIRVRPRGSWLFFEVVEEGILGRINSPDRSITLFDDLSSSIRSNGFESHYGVTRFGGHKLSVGYRRTANVRMFCIVPPPVKVAVSYGFESDLFVREVAPFLGFLEKHGGWEFSKDERGNYELFADATPDFAFDDVPPIYVDGSACKSEIEAASSLAGLKDRCDARETNVSDIRTAVEMAESVIEMLDVLKASAHPIDAVKLVAAIMNGTIPAQRAIDSAVNLAKMHEDLEFMDDLDEALRETIDEAREDYHQDLRERALSKQIQVQEEGE